jgi:hypothetical protein
VLKAVKNKKYLPKNPANGGIPAIENKIIIKPIENFQLFAA